MLLRSGGCFRCSQHRPVAQRILEYDDAIAGALYRHIHLFAVVVDQRTDKVFRRGGSSHFRGQLGIEIAGVGGSNSSPRLVLLFLRRLQHFHQFICDQSFV